MREETEFRPKPMAEIGGKPILWHIMKTFSSYGHTEFVICAGYKGHMIKEYFANFALHSKDFTTKLGSSEATVFHGESEESEWRVTVSDTGLHTQTGGRLGRVRRYVDEETFFCTYGDGVAPVKIDKLLQHHKLAGLRATMTVTRPSSRFGVVEIADGDVATGFLEKPMSRDFVNMGYFVFDSTIFDGLQDETALEKEPLERLATARQLSVFRHEGFWQPMDTFREFQNLNSLWDSGEAPWKQW